MKVEALRTLVAVVERGSLAAASAEIGLTASAVSLQMKQLESWFGRPLFDRSGRAVRATPLAIEISAVASRLLGEIERFRTTAQPSIAGFVHLGVISSVQTSALPGALRMVRSLHKGLDIRLSLGTSEPLLNAVSAGEIDAAVVVRPKGGGSSRLDWRNLTQQPFVLITPKSAPEDTPQEALARWPWIRYDISLTGGRAAAQYVRRVRPGLEHAYEVADTDAIAAMVAEGLGVSVIPRPRAAIRRGHAMREISLGPRGPVRQIALVNRHQDAENRRLAAIFDVFRFVFKEDA